MVILTSSCSLASLALMSVTLWLVGEVSSLRSLLSLSPLLRVYMVLTLPPVRMEYWREFGEYRDTAFPRRF